MLFVLSICFILTFTTVQSVYTTISSTAELVAFANEVNSGTTYRGSTVSLTADIDMSNIINFTCIGGYDDNNKIKYFRGTFNGNGHVISNMHLFSTIKTYLGLFGVVNGGEVSGIVVDSSCSIENNVTEIYTYSGGIIGHSVAGLDFKMYDCVNMATITGIGLKTNLGGIAGGFYALEYNMTIYNCVNLGKITNYATSKLATTGGIVGWLTSNKDLNVAIGVYNCVNFGIVTSASVSFGAIVGLTESTKHTIKNNYYLTGTSTKVYYRTAIAEGNEEFTSDYKISSTGASLVSTANAFVTNSGMNLHKWGTVTFNTSYDAPISSKLSFIVLLGTPDILESVGRTFHGWYTDSAMENIWNVSTQFGEGDYTLYAKWTVNKYSVIINFDNGTEIENVVEYNEKLPIPLNLTREGYTFMGWNNSVKVMPAENLVIKALWNINNYTLTFNFDNGTEIEKVVDYKEIIDYPENPERLGYKFLKWDNNITVMPADDVTIKALWAKIYTEYVEIVFDKKDMNENEIREVISRFVDNDNYVIKIIESGDNGGTTVIIKFSNSNKADEFVEAVTFASDADINLIKRIGYHIVEGGSLRNTPHTFVLLFNFFLFICLSLSLI